ncbi:MAG TPA: FAD binding domain-containing protein, partial [Hyphomicrobiaceae bacterium]|nr:FAD binding domain-containing protein [Hyphomicrobiaceae bacterium]
GALTTHAELARNTLISRHAPLLAEGAKLIAHAAIRNLGTIGGSLAFADPAAELPACCVALEATILTRSAKGERRIAADQFFTGLYTTALATDELIVAVEVPKARADERSAIDEVTRRRGDYAMAGVAVRARLAGGAFAGARIAFFGVGDGPVRADGAMQALDGKSANAGTIAAAQAALDRDLDPPGDQHGTPATKRHLARVVLGRALSRVAGIGGAGGPA